MASETHTWSDQTSPDILKAAIEGRDYGTAGKLMDLLCADLDNTARRIDARIAKSVLAWLRKYAWFDRLKQMAEKFEQHAQNDRKVLLQLAQARIELGDITCAVDGLLDLEARLEKQLADSDLDRFAKEDLAYDLGEAMGLLGRCYKQYYVNAGPSQKEPRHYDLSKSLEYYTGAFEKGLGDYLWHGINRVAILNHQERIARNSMTFISAEAEDSAQKILKAIERKAHHGPLQPWDLANCIEANLALGKTQEAVEATKAYLDHKDVDAFNVQSTRRQLVEVWMLNEHQPPGREILPMMTARYAELGCGPEAVELDPAKAANFEKVWGRTRYKPMEWLAKAFDRAKSVARIGPSKYEGDGTGFLFDGARIAEQWRGKPLLLTNAHVCSNDPEVQAQIPHPSPSHELTAAFLGAGGAGETEEIRFRKLIWSSKPSELDATLLLLENAPEGWEPLPITSRVPPATLKGDARLNILGHPRGLDLRISLQDNIIVDVGSKYVHYQTPTDPGSSGSPVFNQRWDVVALHHASSSRKQANEGIRIDVIIEEIKSALL